MDVSTVIVSAGVGAVFGIATQWFGAWISGRYWVAQQKWKLRGDSYRRLFDALAEIHSLYKWLHRVEVAVPEAEQKERAQKQTEQLVRFHSARAMARGFVSGEASAAVDSLADEFERLKQDSRSEDFDFDAGVERAMRATDKAIRKLSNAARTDFSA